MKRPGVPAFLLTLLAACSQSAPLAPSQLSPIAVCDPITRSPGAPLSLERGRAERVRAEERRHRRMEEALDPGLGLRSAQTEALFEHEYSAADGLAPTFRRVQTADGGPETIPAGPPSCRPSKPPPSPERSR
ncbi:MAG: hypothetical protein ACI9WU_002477 [Myxococcota bacterium]|jgi:hypothetical protein